MSARLCRSFLLTLALSATITLSAVAQTPILHDGDQIDLRGMLVIKRSNWSEFLVLRTARPYRLLPSAEAASPDSIQEFGLTLPGQDDLLARSAGRPIRVSGRLQLAQASSYCWNGTLIFATTVALPGGNYLSPRPPDPGLPLSVRRYSASATLQPKLWPRLYTARDLDTHRSISIPNLAGCRVSGGGDVLNCFCSDGFQPTRSLLHTAAGAQSGTMSQSFVQFALPTPADTPVTAEVECARPPPKD